jgi:hypothetical protein
MPPLSPFKHKEHLDGHQQQESGADRRGQTGRQSVTALPHEHHFAFPG